MELIHVFNIPNSTKLFKIIFTGMFEVWIHSTEDEEWQAFGGEYLRFEEAVERCFILIQTKGL